ncbi:MFS transporter [Bailinhaonella thermotolerans]|uniref:MFS transporter n=2 Tax=Bailinhaonella thermotolerans TaxID=1070861 RepID=A0A3A4A149_9ACTN|nr:MFS transporter [Bailinhaonella thermotolerans]
MLLVAMAGTFLAILDSFIVNVAVPSIRADLNATFAQVELAVSGYVLVYGLLLVTGGRLGDLFGARRLFMIGTAVFTLASLAAGLAPGPVTLIAFRVAQAVGAALLYPQVLAVLQTAFTGRAKVRAFAVFGATIGLASIAGQVIGGLLIHLDLFGLGWRNVFLVNVPLGLLTLVGASRTLPGGGARGARLDLVGVGLLSGALLLLSLPLVEGHQSGWPAWTFVSLAAAAPVGVAFVAWERRLAARGGSPLVNPRLFRLRTFSAGSAIGLAFFAGNAGLFFVLTLELQTGLGYGPLTAGLTFVPLAVAFAAASLLAPRLQGRLGRHVLTLGYAVNAAGTLALLVTAWAAGPALTGWLMVPALTVIGFGEGLGVSPLTRTALSQVPAEDAGAAGGVLGTANELGMSLGVSVLGLVFFTALGSHDAAPGAYTGAFTIALVGNLALALTALALLPPLLRERA